MFWCLNFVVGRPSVGGCGSLCSMQNLLETLFFLLRCCGRAGLTGRVPKSDRRAPSRSERDSPCGECPGVWLRGRCRLPVTAVVGTCGNKIEAPRKVSHWRGSSAGIRDVARPGPKCYRQVEDGNEYKVSLWFGRVKSPGVVRQRDCDTRSTLRIEILCWQETAANQELHTLIRSPIAVCHICHTTRMKWQRLGRRGTVEGEEPPRSKGVVRGRAPAACLKNPCPRDLGWIFCLQFQICFYVASPVWPSVPSAGLVLTVQGQGAEPADPAAPSPPFSDKKRIDLQTDRALREVSIKGSGAASMGRKAEGGWGAVGILRPKF